MKAWIYGLLGFLLETCNNVVFVFRPGFLQDGVTI